MQNRMSSLEKFWCSRAFQSSDHCFHRGMWENGASGVQNALAENQKHLRMYFSCPQCIAAVALQMFLCLVLEELSQSPNHSSM